MKYKYENTLVNSELERVDILLRKGKYEDAYNTLTWIEKITVLLVLYAPKKEFIIRVY